MSAAALVARLIPSVRDMVPAEGRAALVSVVELAKGAKLIGPPPLSPALRGGCQMVADGRVPWQLIAAAVHAVPGATHDELSALADVVVAGDLIEGVVTWAGRETAGEIVLNYLVLLTRELDPSGLDALVGVFG